jgi:DNA polymerase I-like protein with 3'-5' exonuclease and polymerase domains
LILKADAAQLEWRVKAFLSQDPIAIKEIAEDLDLHTDNQQKFGLPSRLIAKIFLYRMIFADAFSEMGYSRPAYAYANDPEFSAVSTSTKFWEKVIDRFFAKYAKVREHSLNLIRTAISEGQITTPSGRFYKYAQRPNKRGQPDWPRTEILNHIVQGLAADFMMECRAIASHRLKRLNYGHRALLINTVHDDIEMDVDNDPELVYNICIMLKKCFQDIPKAFEKHFGVVVNVPMDGEVKFGWSLYEPLMMKFKPNSFEKDWETINAI